MTKASNFLIHNTPANVCGNRFLSRLVRNATRLVILLPLLISSQAFADGFYPYGSTQDKLKKTVIIDAGDAQRINIPYSRENGITDTKAAIKIADRCFEPLGYLWGTWISGKKAALLLMDQSKSFKVALLESEGSYAVKVDVITVTELDCMDTSTGDPQMDLKKQMDDYQLRQNEYLKEINRLKGTN